MKSKIMFLISLLVLLIGVTASVALAGGRSLSQEASQVRAATARFHDLSTTQAEGYGPFLGCISEPGQGAMGFHYVNGTLVNNAVVDPLRPEGLLYEMEDGQLQLTGVEYVVFQTDWQNAGHSEPPSLFGQTFNFIGYPNRFGLPPFYSLHFWVWKANPSGPFAQWNPAVSC